MKRDEDVKIDKSDLLWMVYYLKELSNMFTEVLENGSELQDEQKEKLLFQKDREVVKYDFPFLRDKASVQMDRNKLEKLLYQVESILSGEM